LLKRKREPISRGGGEKKTCRFGDRTEKQKKLPVWKKKGAEGSSINRYPLGGKSGDQTHFRGGKEGEGEVSEVRKEKNGLGGGREGGQGGGACLRERGDLVLRGERTV